MSGGSSHGKSARISLTCGGGILGGSCVATLAVPGLSGEDLLASGIMGGGTVVGDGVPVNRVRAMETTGIFSSVTWVSLISGEPSRIGES
jgi:hypothetical protein